MPHSTDGKPAMPAMQGALGHFTLLEASGRDAAAFLQAQTMNDVAALADLGWHWNGLLSAKGRVLALFALLRLDPERFLLLLPDVPATMLAEQLRRYVFRAKVQLAPRTLQAEGLAGAGVDAFADPARAQADAGGWRLDMGSAAAPRQLHVTLADAASQPDVATGAAWRRLDLLFGLPRLADAQSDQYTPQMLSLQRLAAFSLSKGCYPGQEIVARTHYLGQARRTLRLLRVAGACEPGDAVEAGGSAIGQVASVAADGDGTLALAVCADSDAMPSVAGAPAEGLLLLDGLGRTARAS